MVYGLESMSVKADVFDLHQLVPVAAEKKVPEAIAYGFRDDVFEGIIILCMM